MAATKVEINSRREETIASLIGEGVHTGLRKWCDSKPSHEAWKAIQDMPDREWNMVVVGVAEEIVSYLKSDEDKV